jgi:hypothetical protein
MSGAGSLPLRIHKAPIPLGPWILCAETATRSGPSGNLDPAERLHRVAQHQRPGLASHARDLGDWLDHADFIVDQHHRDQEHTIVELPAQVVGVEQAVFPDRQDRQVDPLPGEPLACVEHSGMLGRNGDDPIAISARLFHGALECPVERFGRTSGEGDATALEADRFLDLVPRNLDRGGRLRAPARWRMGVGEFLLGPGRIAWATSGATGVVA